MHILQDAIDQCLNDLPNRAFTALIEKKLAEQGIRLSLRQRKFLIEKLKQGGIDTIRFRNWKFWQDRHVALELTPDDSKQVEQKFAEFAEKTLPTLINSMTRDLAAKILTDLRRTWPAYSRKESKQLVAFRRRLYPWSSFVCRPKVRPQRPRRRTNFRNAL